ncbi:MAG TPA: mucoidy inhibitor MuiA family protein [Bacteroidales bacterium]|nr:mucoidy inhibitor MuiA family protein [Bacteroidales bacterium]HOM40725.1 mucoidy inhibitor MuiA family protein [Bacteroidales bacterium]HPP91280.1 mucoidy inhibitor MuiA family protein [Bacteroidales bacterium]HRR15487.1 mucoidy inhibitor MuiA family protein [Bacteroidales bacterium]HRT46873.1 mucoidy inhibitor MuiA family protein [Bacteroidales bacterium]
MKKQILSAAFIIIPLINLIADNEKEIKATLNHVTVYPDRARLTCEAVTEIPAGKTTLKLTGLSPYIDAQSIQVKGSGEFTTLSVNLRNNYISNLEEIPEVKNIRNQIEALQMKIEDEKAAISTLDERLSFLQANKAVLVKETTFSIEQFKSLMELYTSNIEQINAAKLKKSRLIKDYERQITMLQQQISDRMNKNQLPSGEISVTVEAMKPVSAKILFEYNVSNAGWYPSYDIRVDDITKPVLIYYKANVFQNTGVEWKNVKLSFSTATPWIAGNVPVLNPWFIDFFVPVTSETATRGEVAAYGVARKAPVMMENVIMADRNTFLKKEAEAVPVTVEKRTGEMSVTFDIATLYSIPSDGKTQTIEIQRTTTPAEYKYAVVPKMSPHAYLTCNITDWAKQSLLSGEANLYFENTYVGKSQLDINQLSDTLSISLGTDPGILIKREKRKDFTSKKIIGANKTDIYSFLITLRNNKATAVRITVNDQIPVSSNSQITVEAVELSGGKLNNETGLVTWDLELRPGETKELVLTYSVRYPKNQTIILE